MQNILGAIITMLRAESTISNLVSARVFGEELPAIEAGSMPRQSLVVKHSGGPGQRDYIQHVEGRFDFFSYGETPNDALLLAYAVHDFLGTMKPQVVSQTKLHYAARSSGFISFRDQDTKWPVVSEAWLILAGEQAAT